jgi:uncharacterized protein YndB with AHSA1/START domain/tRNA A-37 threonylcarbamoyl transferase component Bud32
MPDFDPDATTLRNQDTAVPVPGGFLAPTPAELAGRLPGLEVSELIGQGGMGVVYKGRQSFLDRPVAIKLIRPDLQADDGLRDRFLREARTLAKLRHPYIVTVFDAAQAGDLAYLVMEYVEGESLRDRLAKNAISERDALEIVPQMAEALEHAHEAGVVHRDVKPENVLVDSLGRVRLVDFGLATLLGSDDDHVAGTLAYMAPEQIDAPGSVDHRADIYATGVVLYEMLAHELPGADRVPPSRKAATDPRLDPVALRALERDRQRRYQQARLLQQDLVAIARSPETTIRLEKYVPAPPEAVFAAWTDAPGMADWYAPSDDFGPTVAELDPRVGGGYRVGMLEPGKTERRVVTGEYCCVDAPRKLSFTWAWQTPRPDVHETQLTVEFRPRGPGTDVVLTHERFRDVPHRDGHEKGWTGCLERLARKLGK